jgi:hypothetical protein
MWWEILKNFWFLNWTKQGLTPIKKEPFTILFLYFKKNEEKKHHSIQQQQASPRCHAWATTVPLGVTPKPIMRACPQPGCPPPRSAFVAEQVVVATAALLLRATKHAGESSSGSQVRQRHCSASARAASCAYMDVALIWGVLVYVQSCGVMADDQVRLCLAHLKN